MTTPLPNAAWASPGGEIVLVSLDIANYSLRSEQELAVTLQEIGDHWTAGEPMDRTVYRPGLLVLDDLAGETEIVADFLERMAGTGLRVVLVTQLLGDILHGPTGQRVVDAFTSHAVCGSGFRNDGMLWPEDPKWFSAAVEDLATGQFLHVPDTGMRPVSFLALDRDRSGPDSGRERSLPALSRC